MITLDLPNNLTSISKYNINCDLKWKFGTLNLTEKLFMVSLVENINYNHDQ